MIMKEKMVRETGAWFSYLKYLLLSYLLTGGLLLLLSMVQCVADLPEGVINFFLTMIYIISAGVAGFLAGMRAESRSFLFGLLMGCAYFLVLTWISVGYSGEGLEWNRKFVSVMLMCLFSGMLGGIVGRGK